MEPRLYRILQCRSLFAQLDTAAVANIASIMQTELFRPSAIPEFFPRARVSYVIGLE